jgi:hypothetical protein
MLGAITPIMASMTAAGSKVPAFSTAFAHVRADVVGLKRVVANALEVLGESAPLRDEVFVGRVVHAHEVVPGSQVSSVTTSSSSMSL